MKAVTCKRTLSEATHWMMAAGIMLSLCWLQLSWATVAGICEAASEPEACCCAHACAPSGAIHGPVGGTATIRRAVNSTAIDAVGNSPNPSDYSCCRAHPQSERPVVTASTQETAVEIQAPSLMRALAPQPLRS